MGKNNGLGSFLAGALVGAGLGVLFAPKSGAETRRELKEKTEKEKLENNDTLENDLFNLIDSMYEEGEEEEDNG